MGLSVLLQGREGIDLDVSESYCWLNDAKQPCVKEARRLFPVELVLLSVYIKMCRLVVLPYVFPMFLYLGIDVVCCFVAAAPYHGRLMLMFLCGY